MVTLIRQYTTFLLKWSSISVYGLNFGSKCVYELYLFLKRFHGNWEF